MTTATKVLSPKSTKMKHFFVIVMTSVLSASIAHGQHTTSQNIPRADVLLKSKHQKTGAWILLGGGAVLTTVGLAVGVNSAFDELGSVITTGKDDKSFVAGEAFLIAGMASMVGSIPLFIASGRNRRKAMETVLMLKMESRPKIENKSIYSSHYPALSIKFSLP